MNFKTKFSFVTSLSAAETHVFGVKFIGLYGTVVFIAIRDFPVEEKTICGVRSGQRWMESPAFPLGTLRSTTATSTKTSPQNITLFCHKSFAVILCRSLLTIWAKYRKN